MGNNKEVISALKSVLSDTYALYLKTQNYHWNVEGPQFRSLHLMFEEQYKELADAVDLIAELIRGLGAKAPATFDFYASNAKIKSGDEKATAQEMLKELFEDHETMQKNLFKALDKAQKDRDEVVINFITERLTVHRKTAWMLKSSL